MTESQGQYIRLTKEEFLKRVRNCGLISPERLSRALEQMPATERGRVVARGLVEQGLLTKFQAERLLVGRTDGFVIGQYRILDQLGRGGMGRVFKAEHVQMGRVVAIKILSNALLKTERARLLFHREVKAAARLHHPNIVTAFDANQVGDRCYLVMEFVDGPSLHDMVREHGPLPITQACDYVRQAALGLQYAHDLGMVHRDIKPANLLVQKAPGKSNESVVKILDFGLARIGGDEKESGADSIETNKNMVMGTPDFLSPEQARSLRATDGRSDVYSLGCTLHCLLTGQVPFPGGTTMDKLVRQTTEAAKPVNDLRPEVPVEVAIIVQKAMAKKPEDRFQSAAEFASALQSHSGHESANWVAVEPLPEEHTIPLGSDQVPQAGVLDDPWQNLDVAEFGSDQVGTLSGDGAITSVSGATGKYRRQRGRPSWIWALLGIVILLVAVAGLLVLAKRLHIFKS